MKRKTEETLLSATPASRLLGCSAESVRRYEREGMLPAIKLESGLRLFRQSDVLKFREKREAAQTKQLSHHP